LLVWAKIPGYPFWPAKVLRIVDEQRQQFDVRFFGEHDRALVDINKCFWLSKLLPGCNKITKITGRIKNTIQLGIIEVNEHINRLEIKFKSSFNFAPNNIRVDVNERCFPFIEKFKGNYCSSLIDFEDISRSNY
jgi:hypothetical protein